MPALIDPYLFSAVLISANRCRLGLLYVMHTSRGVFGDTVLRNGSIFTTVLNVDNSGHSTRESGETQLAPRVREPTDPHEAASGARRDISCKVRNENLRSSSKSDAIIQDLSPSSQDESHRGKQSDTDQEALSSASPHPLVSASRAINTVGETSDTHQTTSLAHTTSVLPFRLKELAWRSIDGNASPLPWPLEILPIKTEVDISKLQQVVSRTQPNYSWGSPSRNKGKVETFSDVDPVDVLQRLTIMFNKTSSASDSGTFEKGKVRFSDAVDVHVYRSEKYFKRFKFLCCYRQPPPDEYAHFVMPHSATCDADENSVSRSTSLEKMPPANKRAAMDRM